jgi:hypothetical protein
MLNRERRRKATTDLAGDGEDTAGRGVPGGGEAETSPETGMARLATTSPVEVRLKNLGWAMRDLRMGMRWSLELGKIVGVRWSPELRKIAEATTAGGWVR